MNLTIELPDDDAMALRKKAQRRGVSAEAYARHVLEQDLKQRENLRHIAEVMADIVDKTPKRPKRVQRISP